MGIRAATCRSHVAAIAAIWACAPPAHPCGRYAFSVKPISPADGQILAVSGGMLKSAEISKGNHMKTIQRISNSEDQRNCQIVQETWVMDKMKLKITITGENVHNVGYRYFLMTSAIDRGLDGFNARNTMKGNEQQVVALIEGNEEAIADFKKLAESQRPEHSLVSSIAFEDTDSAVMRTGEYAQVCTAVQLNKAIPLLLDIRDDLKEMKGDVKAVRKNTDMIPQMSDDLKAVRKNTDMIPQMSDDLKAVRKNTDIIPQIHEEIKGMREDIQPGYAAQFRLVQADIRAIKERLGMS